MCARECLAGERCDREEACRAADAKYLPLIRARQIELTRARLEQLEAGCRECIGPRREGACNACSVPMELVRLQAKLELLEGEK